MGSILTVIGRPLLAVLIKMGLSLLSERFIKGMMIHGLEILVKHTKNEDDDKLLARCKEEWA